ncbi:MAG: hypothetical protein C5B50_01180 [Verrucomicrobia bacterium]|nr:MAG: hypothetical protein C5B50_01180 [Verrucomicrobiota bacterium]
MLRKRLAGLVTKAVGQAFQPAGCGAFQRRDPKKAVLQGAEKPAELAGWKACPTMADFVTGPEVS